MTHIYTKKKNNDTYLTSSNYYFNVSLNFGHHLSLEDTCSIWEYDM